MHPRDLVPVLLKQIEAKGGAQPRIVNLSGGVEIACLFYSLASGVGSVL